MSQAFSRREDCLPHNGQEWSAARLSGWDDMPHTVLAIRCGRCFPMTLAEYEAMKAMHSAQEAR